jgi:error-prone DNA polymerase
MRSAPARGGGRQLALDLRVGDVPALPEPDAWELLVADYAHVGLSVREHPIARVRRELDDVVSSRDLYELPTGTRIALPGLAIARQRPASAKGIVFLLLEDEFGLVNLILMPDVYERLRLLARTEPYLLTEGVLERRDRNVNVLVDELSPLDAPGHRTLAARRGRRGAALADLRAVAPHPQHFAQGRRR